MKPLRRLAPKQKTARLIEFYAVFIGVLAILAEFFIIQRLEIKETRTQEELILNFAIGVLAVQENSEITSPIIQNGLKWMDEKDFPMDRLNLQGIEFVMAEFDNIKWKNVIFEDIDFYCSDETYDKLRRSRKGIPGSSLCTRLKKADFTGSILDDVGFNYADLRGAKFTNSYISDSEIEDSWASGAEFLKNIEMRAIEISRSDFTNTKFGPGAKFGCSRKYCSELKNTDFSHSSMEEVRFRGTDIDGVDFTRNDLNRAVFDCDGINGDIKCTELVSVCLQDANLERAEFIGENQKKVFLSNIDFSRTNLSKAKFENVVISNVDFTDANIEGARFRNVVFENVSLSYSQIDTKYFDKESLKNLNFSILKDWKKEIAPDELPCTLDWRQYNTVNITKPKIVNRWPVPNSP